MKPVSSNCPNCGAPLPQSESSKDIFCAYRGTNIQAVKKEKNADESTGKEKICAEAADVAGNCCCIFHHIRFMLGRARLVFSDAGSDAGTELLSDDIYGGGRDRVTWEVHDSLKYLDQSGAA